MNKVNSRQYFKIQTGYQKESPVVKLKKRINKLVTILQHCDSEKQALVRCHLQYAIKEYLDLTKLEVV